MISMPTQSLGEHLRELRAARKLSMRQLGALTGIRSPAFIADMERGFRFPSPEVMEKLAEALEVPLRDLHLYDRRPPHAEIRALTEQDPAWAFALRKLVDIAQGGQLGPDDLLRLLSPNEAKNDAQKDLPLWA